jgi:hypothetical protein
MTDEELKALRRAPKAARLSDKQLALINTLLDEREVDPKFNLSMEEIRKAAKVLSSGDASRWINRLLQLPKKESQPTFERNFPDVLPGRYALDTPDGIKFYRVDRPTEGRWAGWTFVSVQASDDLYPVKGYQAKLGILEDIAKDPLGASSLYGRELGRCGVCGKTLTNATSRRLGIGPKCRSRL